MSSKWWILTVLVEVCWLTSAFADKKEKGWPPMPPLDTLIGDTSGAITIRDSALIPTFGIYPATGWGKALYIDTNTFDKKFGLIVLFDPWSGGARDLVDFFSEFRDKIQDDWGFEVFLVACQMAVTSCQPEEYEKERFWDCRTFLISDFKKQDSLRNLLVSLKWSYPVYRLKQPLVFNLPTGDRPPSIVLLSAKQQYAVDYLMFPSFSERMSKIEKLLLKPLFQMAFYAEKKYLKKWKYVASGKTTDK